MKRDLNLIRKILLAIEESNSVPISFKGVEPLAQTINVVDFASVSFHVSLLIDANYIEATDISIKGVNYKNYFITRLTNNGCDYIDSIRDISVWQKTQEKLQTIGGSASLDVIKTIATQIILKALQS